MADVKCPVCGQQNPADATVCGNCKSPLTGAPAPIQPGEIPTKKSTSELEPILPEWLRDARDKARQSAAGDLEQIQPPSQAAQLAGTSASDLLAGLQAQSADEEEEIPDWLSSLTGKTGAGGKAQPEEPQASHWVELGGRGDSKPEDKGANIPPAKLPVESGETSQNELPPWLASLTAGQPESAGSDESQPGWLKDAETPPPAGPASETGTTAGAVGSVAEAELAAAGIESTPDWLSSLQADATAPAETSEEPIMSDTELPDWLKGEEPAAPERPVASSDAPDWLKTLGVEQAIAPAESQPATVDNELPAWLKGEEPAAPEEPVASSETPDWLKTLGVEQAVAPAESQPAAKPATVNDELPAWLKSEEDEEGQGPRSSVPQNAGLTGALGSTTEPPKPTAAFTEAPAAAELAPSEPLDWLKSLDTPEKAAPASAVPPASPALTPEGSETVFTGEPLSAGDLDSLLKDMPDWLSDAAALDTSHTAGEELPLVPSDDAISPASLPSWVQAMRPVEAASGVMSPGAAEDDKLETQGALAGLHGVLPSAPLAIPSGKPKAQSIKLQVSEEQQTHAALLDEILAAEAKPEPITSGRLLSSQKILRWIIAILLFIVLAGAVFSGTSLFPLPLGRPAEVMSALSAVDLLPQGAPVLVVFDYEPSLAGEMQAAAAPLLDHLIVARHPRLALLSTSATGSVLAERFFAGPLAGSNYRRGNEYVNLGYLPGGLSGVRAFAQDPVSAMPFTVDGNLAWESAPLQGVGSFQNFAAIIVITDSADAGRTWIEQAGPLRGPAPLLVASSAQAGPMIQPYYQSGQINGLVTGLYDSAVMESYLEQNNTNSPTTARRYWDAYNLGLLLTVALLLGGSLWSMVAGLRERAAEAEAG